MSASCVYFNHTHTHITHLYVQHLIWNEFQPIKIYCGNIHSIYLYDQWNGLQTFYSLRTYKCMANRNPRFSIIVSFNSYDCVCVCVCGGFFLFFCSFISFLFINCSFIQAIIYWSRSVAIAVFLCAFLLYCCAIFFYGFNDGKREFYDWLNFVS